MTRNPAAHEFKFKVSGYRLGNYALADNESFSLEKAHAFLDNHMAKKDVKKEKIRMKVYHNGIHINKGSFFSGVNKQFYSFDSIHRFFVFTRDRKLLVLGLLDVGKKKYVLLHFKTETDTNKLCDTIEQYKGPTRTVPINNHNDYTDHNVEMVQTQPLETFVAVNNTPEEPKNTYVEETYITTERTRGVHAAPPVQNGNAKYIDCEILDDDRKIVADYHQRQRSSPSSPRKMESVLLSSSRPASENNVWTEDIKYITYNPKIGSVVADNGPIYMYTAHQITPEYRGYSMCTSSSSSTASGDEAERMRQLTDTPVIVDQYDNDDRITSPLAIGGSYNVSAGAKSSEPHFYTNGGERSDGGEHYSMRF